jgi:hypothetical protein
MDRGLDRQSERDRDEAALLGLGGQGPGRILVLGVGLQLDGLLDLDDPEAAVGPADDAFGADVEVVQRQLLTVGERRDGDREAGGGSGDERVLRAPRVRGGVAMSSGCLPSTRLARWFAGCRPRRSQRGIGTPVPCSPLVSR